MGGRFTRAADVGGATPMTRYAAPAYPARGWSYPDASGRIRWARYGETARRLRRWSRHRAVPPGGQVVVTVDMLAPMGPRTYQEDWQTENGIRHDCARDASPVVWALIVVPWGASPVAHFDLSSGWAQAADGHDLC